MVMASAIEHLNLHFVLLYCFLGLIEIFKGFNFQKNDFIFTFPIKLWKASFLWPATLQRSV